MVREALQINNPEVQRALESVCDPEVPVLSIFDLGVVRKVDVLEKHVQIDLTPTYSGCPAMDTIAMDIMTALAEIGYTAKIKHVLSPAWTTDWISEEGRKKLEAYGIAAPRNQQVDKRILIGGASELECTNCGSTNTQLVSEFGSTACKALFRCLDCLEPFDYFKCLK